MNFYHHKNFWKIFLLLFAVLIGMGSLFFTKSLVERLKTEEHKNVTVWAEAIRLVAVSDTSQNVYFLSAIIDNNTTIPVILTDEADSIISAKNFRPEQMDDPGYMKKALDDMKKSNNPIIIDLENGHFNNVYYRDSIILIMLIYYPYVQLSIIILFILVSYLAFSSSRRAEQNQVWVGMSKETAHQLGTPTSSLAGWIELMKERYADPEITSELERDVERLEKITERFSRIGSKPLLSDEDIYSIVIRTIDYLKIRTSSKVKFNAICENINSISAPVNAALFEWVIENVMKNAVDAMEGIGEINVIISENERSAIIDITDSGKGIPRSLFKKIFNPGFTTKKRGWGLGLSLAKRIIEEYHHGKIFVRQSEPGSGLTMRIILNRKRR